MELLVNCNAACETLTAGDIAMKIATEHPDIIDDPDRLSPPASEAEAARMFEIHARGRFPGVTSRLSRAATCRYTNTPKAKSLIAPHPEMPEVTVVSSCSGHGFKLSTALGEAIAELRAMSTQVRILGSYVNGCGTSS